MSASCEETDPTTATSVMDAIRRRRSIFEFRPEPVPPALLRDLFEAGTWAPNHRHTEPWRFACIGPETRLLLRERYGEIQQEKGPDMSPEARKTRHAAGLKKFDGKPTIVVVSCLHEGDTIRKHEDYAATCCAMQNVALAAWEAGVGMQWSTGPITRETNTYECLNLDASREIIIGFFYMGYPAKIPRARRLPIDDVFRCTP